MTKVLAKIIDIATRSQVVIVDLRFAVLCLKVHPLSSGTLYCMYIHADSHYHLLCICVLFKENLLLHLPFATCFKVMTWLL